MEQKPAAIINFNSDTAYFIGVLQGDGNINKSFNKKGWLMTYGIRVAVSYKDKDYVNVLKKLIIKNFGYNPPIHNAARCYDISIYDRSLVRAFEEFKRNMKIPDFALKDTNSLAAYLQGLFDTNGCCSSRGTNGVIDFSNNRKELVESVRSILESKFNIKSYIRLNKKEDYKPVYRLMISNKLNVVPFIEQIGFRHPRKKRLSEGLLKIYKKMPTRSIRNMGHEKVIESLKRKHEMTTNDIANKLNLHRETVKEHLEKLEKKKIVEKRIVYFNRWGIIKKPSCKRYYWRLKNV